MFTRVGGTALALVAALTLALSIAGGFGPLPGWWSGHPSVKGTLIKAKDVDVGLIGSRGCNTGGDKKCQDVKVTGAVKATGLAAAGTTGLLAVASALLALAIAQQRERRKGLAKLAVIAVLVAGVAAIALIVQGPGVVAEVGYVSVPLGAGSYLFAIGMMSAIVASVLGLRPAAPPRAYAPAQQRGTGPAHAMPGYPAQPHTGQQQVDVLALLQEDSLRPAALGPEPRMGRPTPPPPYPGPPVTGAQAPYGMQPPASASQPLFQGAPQLRPLYEAAPNVGGTSGFVPSHQAPRHMRPPTPIPREQISARTGLPTPLPFAAPPGGAEGDAIPDEVPHPMDPAMGPADPQLGYAPTATMTAAVPPPEPPQRRVSTSMGAGAPPSPGASGQMPAMPPPTPSGPPATIPPPLPPGALQGDAPRASKTLPPPIRGKSASVQPFSLPPLPGSGPPPPRPSGLAPIPPPPVPGAPVPPPPVPPFGARPQSASKPPPPLGEVGPMPGAAPFVPMVPFPSAESKARAAFDRAPTSAFTGDAETDTVNRQDVADPTGLQAAAPEGGESFESATAEAPHFGGRGGTEADGLAEAGTGEKANQTDMDLPLAQEPDHAAVEAAARAAAEEEAARAAEEEELRAAEEAVRVAAEEAERAAAEAKPKDRLARGLRAFGIKPTERDETGMFKLKTGKDEERPPTSPLIPPPAPSPSPARTSQPMPAATAVRTSQPMPAAPAAPAVAAPAAAALEPSASGSMPKLPVSTAPASLPPPSEKQSMASGPSPACPQCEAPMAWVEEHLRFYCKSCKMYF